MKAPRFRVFGAIGLLLAFVAGPAAQAQAAPPDVLNVTGGATTAGRFDKMEWRFDLSKSYANPFYFYDPTDTAATNPSGTSWFGVDGVTVNLVVVAPSGQTLTVPAFFLENYLRVRDTNNGVEVLGKSDNGRWTARFTPAETGVYQYYFTAQDVEGSTRYPAASTLSFTVSSSTKKGFVRASSVDSRFMIYDDGSSFVPIGSGRQWWNNNALRSYDYESAFQNFGANGVNLTRVWDQSDFALAVEGASQPVWLSEGTMFGAARGIEVSTANVRTGLRSARPASGQGWYQRLAVSEPTRSHKLTLWLRTDAVSGGQAQAVVRSGALYNSGTLLGQITPVSGTTAWTAYSVTFTPNTSVVTLNLLLSTVTGTMYVDDVAFGPVDAQGNILYNIVSDGGFERHFFKDNPGNDPNATPTLPRPIGSYMNPWAGYELDKIIESAETNGVKLQLCSCSGPWFTWPRNIAESPDSEWAQPWVQKFWQRNFRYRVARWGYSTAVLGFELFNEMGHIPPNSNIYAFFQTYGAFQRATDPYRHIRTNSQNSQAYSPGYWSSPAMDASNYHWYLDGHLTTLDPDESLTISRFAWCLTDNVRGTSSPYCQGLGLGDGSTWTGAPKPWVWGEIGVGVDGTQNNTGEAGSRFLHNIVWTGLFSPLGTTPLEWWWYQEDATSTAAKFNARKAASAFFAGVDYAAANFSFLTTPSDIPPGYTGETIAASDARARVYGMRRADKRAAYLWVQHREHTYARAAIGNTAISPTVTIGNLNPSSYRVEVWNTRTGVVASTQTLTPTGGSLAITLANLSDDVAVKLIDQSTTTGAPAAPTNVRIVR